MMESTVIGSDLEKVAEFARARRGVPLRADALGPCSRLRPETTARRPHQKHRLCLTTVHCSLFLQHAFIKSRRKQTSNNTTHSKPHTTQAPSYRAISLAKTRTHHGRKSARAVNPAAIVQPRPSPIMKETSTPACLDKPTKTRTLRSLHR
jgi:hypothetical protein